MISLLCEWRGNGGSYCVVFKPAFESNSQSVATRMNSTTPLNPTQSQKFPLLTCESGTPCRCFIVPLCFLCVSVSSSSLGRTPTTRCSRQTTATVIWASRRRTWAAAGWSDTSCGGRAFSWGQYSPVRHPTAPLWRSYRAADGHDVSRRRPRQAFWTKVWCFLLCNVEIFSTESFSFRVTSTQFLPLAKE